MYTVKIELWRKIRYSHISKSLRELFLRFSGNELYLVGGCVRDLLLDKEPKDYDLCTNLKPEAVKELLKDIPFDCDANTAIAYHLRGEKIPAERYHFIDTGLKHGTITVHDNLYDLFYEITTYRVDGKYSDGRHPDEVKFTSSLEEDLKRRDFTINSFAYNLITDELVMLDKSFLDDLNYGIIRAVGASEERFTEDALRMLRAIRFASQLGFIIDSDTYISIIKYAHLLDNVSKERIRDELTKILLSDNPHYIEHLMLTGLEPYALGKHVLSNMAKCEHDNPWHYTDVLHHTLDVLQRVPATVELRWASLLHDVGKPKVKQLKPGTTNHYRYIGHEKVSQSIAYNLLTELKFPNTTRDTICKLIKYHDRELADCSMPKFRVALAEIGVDLFPTLMKLRQADASAHKSLRDDSQSYFDSTWVHRVSVAWNRYVQVLNNNEPLTLKDLAVNGDDMKELGLEGKQVGEALKYLLSKVIEKPERNQRDYLTNLIKEKFLTNIK